jgi:antitoxin (DNA-binding transcriptional repressor) of toxin-antitoxin stability system
MSVPLDEANRNYAEILRQVEAGTLVIQGADSNE